MIDRRTFARAAGLGPGTAATAQAADAADIPGPAAPSTLGTLRRVRAGVVDIGYAEAGPPHGPVVVCLHGRPYDIHSRHRVLAGVGHNAPQEAPGASARALADADRLEHPAPTRY